MLAWRSRLVSWVLVPVIAIAAVVLSYYTWQSALKHARLGDEVLVESTLLLVSEKVEGIERWIINQDNAVFALVDPEDPRSIEETWPPLAEDLSPSVKAVVILGAGEDVLALSMRAGARERAEFEHALRTEILPQIKTDDLPDEALRHLHKTVQGHPSLLSYSAVERGGIRVVAIAYHDTGYIVREQLPQLFQSEEGREQFNVVDKNNHRLYGPNLAEAGDYLVGRRFPTTLYGWRLQIAPKSAPLLGAQARSRWRVEVAMVATALLVLLLGVAYVLFAAAKEHRLNTLRGEFVANVSHELKTPLSVIRMFSEMLLTRRVRSEEKQLEYLGLICRESERLSALIDNVLDFAAVEGGKRTFELRDGDVAEIVRHAIETFRFRIEEVGLQLEVQVAPDLPRVLVDEQALVLAVVNLLDNAAKYGGGTPISVRARREANEILLTVHDHGPGIPPEDLKRVFERFYRSRRKHGTRGSGIGLSLVKYIAGAHGGRTFARNAPGGGAEVTLTLPIQPLLDAPAEGVVRASHGIPPPSSPP